MGCFLGCFGDRKNRRRQKRRESDQAEANKFSVESAKPDHLNDRVPAVVEIPNDSVIPITEICNEVEEKCSPSPTRKTVTFDSKVKTYEPVVLEDSVELLEEKKEEAKSEESSVKSNKTDQSSSSENTEVASSGSYPSNHRYKNCRESDDEVEGDELYCGESDLDEEYYSDEAFSEDKLHNQTKEVYAEEIFAKLSSSNESVSDGNHYAQGVLNPVENLTQWKSAKSRAKIIQKQSQKENSNLISDQEDQGEKRDSSSFGTNPQVNDTTLSCKPKSIMEPKKPRNEEITVDASLSTWLSTSETGSESNSVSITPDENKSGCSSKRVINSHDDRPILCALTLEEIKQLSATSTPRKSPSKSPDETPIIGTVGGYWGNHLKAIDRGSASSFKGIPNTSSKYREDKSVNWHSTPFEARLEKALSNRDK